MSSSTSRAPGKSTGRFTVIHNLNAILHISQLFCSAPLYQLKLPPSEPATSATKGALTAITAKLCAIVGALLRFVHILYSLTYAVMLFYVVVRGTRLTDRYNMAIVEVCIIFTRFLCNNMTTVLILLGCQIRPQRFQRFVDEVTTIDRRLSRLDEERPPHSDAQHLAAPPNDDGDDDAALTIGLYWSPAVRASLRCSLVSVVALLSALSFLDYADAGFTMAAAAKTHIVYILPACTLCLSMLQFVAALRLLEHMFGRVVGLVQRVLGGRQIMRGSGDGDGDSIAWGGAETSKRQSLTPLLLLKRKRRESVRSAASVASSSTTASGGAGGDAAAYLNALRLEHIRLTRIYNGILDGYGLAVLGIVLTSIMDLTLQVFFFYKVAVNLTTATWTYMVYAALWVLMIIGRIFFAVSMCDRVNTVVGFCVGAGLGGRDRVFIF